ncbi:preprotein translocase subunit SecG [Candidatus Haliotispira prima]|uniref:Protein-export membrane protein SecG n=1 Tax=Candidatus Haliotispira prima TaxID=3034016 RepID=A0ABY8MGY5_9SPIO|nr:preprotein translocase subunit SecG [Candidatus Haliotispira prima]
MTILITLLVISAIITVLLILLQDDQGSGMGLFGSSGQSPFSTGDSFLARLTKIFGTGFLVLCLVVAFVISRFGVNYEALQEAQGEYQNRDESAEESWFLRNPDRDGDVSDEDIPDGDISDGDISDTDADAQNIESK